MSALTPSKPTTTRHAWHILRLPLLVFLTSGAGLAAALLGDGWWHGLSWLLLAIPLLVIAAALRIRPRPDTAPTPAATPAPKPRPGMQPE